MENPYKRINVNGKGIDEHRHIMQLHLGRKLKRFEFVHHINGDKKDNRIENLELMNGHQHAIEHNQKYSISKLCIVCGKEYIPHKTKRLRSKVCSNECKVKLDNINSSKRKIPIIQYSLNGEFIKVWDSARDIKNELGFHESNISKCCKNKINTAYRFVWKYKNLKGEMK